MRSGQFRDQSVLQRRFVQVLLRRAQQALQVPLDEGDTYRNPNGTLMPGTVISCRVDAT